MPQGKRYAYADPPYIGYAKYYKGGVEVDHEKLIASLAGYDGWALSCHSPSLAQLLPLCPPKVRILAWFRTNAMPTNIHPNYAWEPVIVCVKPMRSSGFMVRDALVTPFEHKGLIGAKPDLFYSWLFRVLNIQPTDTIDDLYPGTHSLERCLDSYRRQMPLVFPKAVAEKAAALF